MENQIVLCQTGINTPQFALLGPPHRRPPAPPPWKHNSRLLNSPLSGPERLHCPGEERAGLGPRAGLQRGPAPDSAAGGSASVASLPCLGNLGQRASVSPLDPEASVLVGGSHYRAVPSLKVKSDTLAATFTQWQSPAGYRGSGHSSLEAREMGERWGEGEGRAQPRTWNRSGFKLYQGHFGGLMATLGLSFPTL